MNELQLAIDLPSPGVALWDPERQARRTDPQTSHDAAAAAGGLAHEHCTKILAAMPDIGGLTAEEISDRCGLTPVQVNRRIHGLIAANKLADTGETRPSRAGRQMRVLRKVTP